MSQTIRPTPRQQPHIAPSITITFGNDPSVRILSADLYEQMKLERVARRFFPMVVRFWTRNGGATR